MVMETIFSLIFPLVVALVLAVAALYRGADTRPGFDERPDRTRFGPMN
jgi:hypothetical protein